MYEIIRFRGEVSSIRRLSDGACIPFCEDNRDYIEFKKWHNEQPEESKLDMTDKEEVIPYDQKRKAEYEQNGLSSDALVVALWEKIVEGKDSTVNEIQALRVIIKEKYKKE